MKIRRADKIDGCITDLREIGFVFSDSQVDAAIATEDAIAMAKQVLLNDRIGKRTPRYGYETDQNQPDQ